MKLFRYGSIRIGTVKDSSSVHFGNNFIGGRVERDKYSDGVGDMIGLYNHMNDAKHLIVDTDVVDGGGQPLPKENER